MRATGSDSSCNSVCLGWATNLASLPSASPRGEDTCLIQSRRQRGGGGLVPAWLFFPKKVWGIIRRKTSHYVLWGLNEFSCFWGAQSNLVPLFMGKRMKTCSQKKKQKTKRTTWTEVFTCANNSVSLPLQTSLFCSGVAVAAKTQVRF